MERKIEEISRKLGAKVIGGTVPAYSAGAFGVAKLARTLRARLEPGSGKAARSTERRADWSKRRSPLAAETEDRLSDRVAAEAQRI